MISQDIITPFPASDHTPQKLWQQNKDVSHETSATQEYKLQLFFFSIQADLLITGSGHRISYIRIG